MTQDTINSDELSLEDKIALFKKANQAYVYSSPIMSDFDFDQLEAELVSALGQEELDRVAGTKVGAPIPEPDDDASQEIVTKKLPVEMLSLRKVRKEEDILAWAKHQGIPLETQVGYEPKWDGLACLVVCNPLGEVESAFLRGQGDIGEDVTVNVRKFWRPALSIDPVTGEFRQYVQGEVLMDEDTMNLVNADPETTNEYTLPRSAAAGILRRGATASGNDTARHLIWRDHNAEPAMTGALRDAVTMVHRLSDEVIAQQSLPTDGVVIKVLDPGQRRALGYNDRNANWSVAYKFPDQLYSTVLREVRWRRGMTKNAPVAYFDPVVIDGSRVSKASLHNIDVIRTLGIHIGDHILVRKAFKIIPQVARVEKPGPRTPDDIIHEVDGDTDFALYMERVAEVLDAKNVGTNAWRVMIDNQLIQTSSIPAALGSIAQLRKDALVGLDGFGEKRSSVVVSALRNAMKGKDEGTWLACLCLPGVGRTMSERITRKVSLEEMTSDDFNFSTLSNIDGVGENTVNVIKDAVDSIENLQVTLALNGIEMKSADGVTIHGHPVNDKNVVLSGDMGIDRKKLAAMLKERGATVKTSVSKKTDVLLAGPGSGEKTTKANTYGIPIVAPEALDDFLEGTYNPF